MGAGGRPVNRPALRPPVGLPAPREHRWRAALVSVLLHVFGALLLLIPAIAALIVHVNATSAGGAGARGGGGLGVISGYIHERLRYVQLPAPEAPPAPTAKPVPKPPPKPPPEPPSRPPTSAAPPRDSSAVSQSAVSQTPGDGAGRDGPGTGGGAGPGVGTGTGNAMGPGAGGSPAASKIHAATDVMTLATIDAPTGPRPFHLHAVFAVDVHGNARLLTVNRADDGDFNRAMRERLQETHFKPATLPNGTPVPDTVAVDIDY